MQAFEDIASSHPDSKLTSATLMNATVSQLQYLSTRLAQESASSIHRSTMFKFQSRWKHIKSGLTCLVCLAAVPQHTTCCHALCETCLQIFGDLNDTYDLKDCLLCGRHINLCVRVRPSTAGQSVLCIDGGGVRGIIPLWMLISIQKHLDLSIPVQELFTMAFGTSVGTYLFLNICLGC